MMKNRIIALTGAVVFYMLFSGAVGDKGENTFKSVKISGLEWMTGNLDVSSFQNGDPVPEARTDAEWAKAGREATPAFCYYENKSENGSKYGKLYNWYAVTDKRGLAPAGWHVSTDAEWREVTDFLGGEDAAGTKMKGTAGWNKDGNGTNESGFTGLPGGCRDLNGKFNGTGIIAFWWTSTEKDNTLAWYRVIDLSPYYVYRTYYYKQNGLSVRCVKNY